LEITVKLHGTLRRFRPAGDGAAHEPFTLALSKGATASAALRELGISQEIISAVAVNGMQANTDTTLSDGDTLHIFPPAAGG
jgi:molybdopterin converting factor small subunit